MLKYVFYGESCVNLGVSRVQTGVHFVVFGVGECVKNGVYLVYSGNLECN